jgi:hypothetical protein
MDEHQRIFLGYVHNLSGLFTLQLRQPRFEWRRFSTGLGGEIYIPDGGCTGLTITNSKFGCQTTSSIEPHSFIFNIQNTLDLVFKYNTIDYSNCQGGASGLSRCPRFLHI